ncbi:hypothetical protein O0L34_g18044 [Tuta absoluta]|nr:hypothetical protein O0L34_g18044 [Tuta absoluta]
MLAKWTQRGGWSGGAGMGPGYLGWQVSSGVGRDHGSRRRRVLARNSRDLSRQVCLPGTRDADSPALTPAPAPTWIALLTALSLCRHIVTSPTDRTLRHINPGKLQYDSSKTAT